MVDALAQRRGQGQLREGLHLEVVHETQPVIEVGLQGEDGFISGLRKLLLKSNLVTVTMVHCISVIPLSDTARNRLKGGFWDVPISLL